MRGSIVLPLTPPPPILLVGREAKFSFKGTVSLNSVLVTVNVFNLFRIYNTEQNVFYTVYKVSLVYSITQYLYLPFCLKEHMLLILRYVGRICPQYNKIFKGQQSINSLRPGSYTLDGPFKISVQNGLYQQNGLTPHKDLLRMRFGPLCYYNTLVLVIRLELYLQN